MYVIKNPVDYTECPIRISLDILSASWNVWLISEINKGVVRPCDLHRSIGIAPKRVLTKQLGELEKKGILEKKIYPVLPLKVEYYLTDKGKELIPIIELLWNWGDKYKEEFANLPIEKSE
ncbi:helix-turn-helix domain-containing protein [Parabacteroides sp. PF5-9]|uniref:winged helix-turn-helix transcriptional regulator n=1 Tax=Parabacteroides sp. PF5-9 TaxID=1742404 RepID=UPI002475216C|nr:helix-turn-helix domain-containing protein [Parabacteroides sp. PF5-9]MDH6357351.1 DNA-binding HxlR family transcriptional regulator [Parabacteroides sp. PF5-9]